MRGRFRRIRFRTCGRADLAYCGRWTQGPPRRSETHTTTPLSTAPLVGLLRPLRRQTIHSGFKSPAFIPLLTLLLRLGAEAAVDFGELAAVFYSFVGQGEGGVFLSGLQV
jgi:hypothetical protein